MSGEYNANITEFVSTIVVSNWKGTGRAVRMNTADYRPEVDGDIVRGPTIRENTPGLPPKPDKNPRIDSEGRVIADMASPALKA